MHVITEFNLIEHWSRRLCVSPSRYHAHCSELNLTARGVMVLCLKCLCVGIVHVANLKGCDGALVETSLCFFVKVSSCVHYKGHNTFTFIIKYPWHAVITLVCILLSSSFIYSTFIFQVSCKNKFVIVSLKVSCTVVLHYLSLIGATALLTLILHMLTLMYVEDLLMYKHVFKSYAVHTFYTVLL